MARTHMRVLLRELPQMLNDILEHAIADEPGWEVMPDPGPAAIEFPASRPDVIILGTNHPADADGAPALLARWPASRVLLITANGQYASLLELQPRRTELGEVSVAELMLAIRQATRRPASGSEPQRPRGPRRVDAPER